LRVGASAFPLELAAASDFIHRTREQRWLRPACLLASLLTLRNISCRVLRGRVAMSGEDTAYNFDRYRQLLAEATDEPKRLAFINLLIEEKARDRLTRHMLHSRLSGLDKAEVRSQSRQR
jgi:hypothetical protein